MAGSSSRGGGNSSTVCNKLAKRCENSFPRLHLSLSLPLAWQFIASPTGWKPLICILLLPQRPHLPRVIFMARYKLLLLLTMVTQLARPGSRWGTRLCPTKATTMMPTHTQADSLSYTPPLSLSLALALSLSVGDFKPACNMSSRCECCKRQCTLIAHCQIGPCLQAEIR